MKDNIKNPNKMIDEIFKKRRESNEELSDEYKELCEYIEPFLQQNPKKLELMRKIQSKIIMLNMDDMLLSAVMLSNDLFRELMRLNIPLKLKCSNCGDTVYDIGEEEWKNLRMKRRI